ncbi:MAG: glycosyltransferase [Flavobacterium sp.]|nr:MAG: glycosyltransferase [Flavobacterium sp.]
MPVTVNFKYFQNTPTEVDRSNLKIFYGGSFGEKDGIEYLISAYGRICESYPNVKLVLTGKGMGQDLVKVNSLIEKSSVKHNIIFPGYLETDSYYAFMNRADIFCMTRVNSKFANAGFPFKLGEFLATGKAVIATNVGDVPKYLSHNINALLISPNSVDELVQSITTLIENPEKILQIGKLGRKTAEENFDTEKVSEKLFSIFKSLN